MSNPKMIMTDSERDFFDPKVRFYIIGFLLSLALLAALVFSDTKVESYGIESDTLNTLPIATQSVTQSVSPLPTVQAPNPYSKYDGQAVRHPHRQPDALVTIKISRYDPALGGVNCFRWGNGTCLSPLANGERWETNYEIAIACPMEWPMGTKVEIGWRLWVCKDRGGAIRQTTSGAYWVDQLTTKTYYAFGTEMEAGVWFPDF